MTWVGSNFKESWWCICSTKVHFGYYKETPNIMLRFLADKLWLRVWNNWNVLSWRTCSMKTHFWGAYWENDDCKSSHRWCCRRALGFVAYFLWWLRLWKKQNLNLVCSTKVDSEKWWYQLFLFFTSNARSVNEMGAFNKFTELKKKS